MENCGEEIISRLKSLQRYEAEISGRGSWRTTALEESEFGDLVKWEDIEEIIKLMGRVK